MKIAHIHVWDKNNKGDLAIVMAVQELLLSTFPKAKIIDYPVEVLKEYDKKKAADLNSSDLIVMGGGGLFYRYFLPFSLQMIRALKAPLAIFGVGYIREVGAPALKAEARDSVIALAKKAKFLSVRENYTKSFLVKYGIDRDKIKVIGDPALLLSENVSVPKLTGKFKLGLNLNYSGWLGFGPWRDDILKAYRDTALYFQEHYGAKVYYLKHHPGEDNIYKELGLKGLKLIDEDPHVQKAVYGRLDLVIGMMLHSCVMAAGALTPEINVAYDLRNRNFARFWGHPETVVELKDLRSGLLLKRAKEMMSKPDIYNHDLGRFVKRVSKRTEEFLSHIKDNI